MLLAVKKPEDLSLSHVTYMVEGETHFPCRLSFDLHMDAMPQAHLHTYIYTAEKSKVIVKNW